MSACHGVIHLSTSDPFAPWRAAGSHGTDSSDDSGVMSAAATLQNARNNLVAGSNVAVGPPVNGDLSSELSNPPSLGEPAGSQQGAASGAEADGEGSPASEGLIQRGGTREYAGQLFGSGVG